MQTEKKENPKQDKAASVAAAQSIIEGYHEGNTIEDKVLRKDMIITMLICIITSPWYMAMGEPDRSNIAHYIIQIDDTMDALDVVHN